MILLIVVICICLYARFDVVSWIVNELVNVANMEMQVARMNSQIILTVLIIIPATIIRRYISLVDTGQK